MTDDKNRPPDGPSDPPPDGPSDRPSEPTLDAMGDYEQMGELERLETLADRPDSAADDQVGRDQVSLGRRLRQPRTIVSIILPLILMVLFFGALPGFKLDQLPADIQRANKALLLAAFVVFYIGFPLRGLRWALLIRGTGFGLKVRDFDRDHLFVVACQLSGAGQAG